MSSRPLEHLVILSVTTTGNYEEGEQGSAVLLAWLILNISKNQVISKDEVYVCPSGGVPSASDLPSGVSEASLQGAGSLDLALKKLHESLTKLAGTTFSIMTNGPLPLRQFLHPEAAKSSLTLQKYLYHYLDLSKEILITFPSAPSTTNLSQIAEYLNINTASEVPRVGMAEVLLICEVVQKLISQGHVFQKLEVIREFDLSKTTTNRSLVKSDCVLSLRGLPYQAGISDVASFLAGLNIVPGAIVLGTNQMGRRTGAAIVVMETLEQVELALKRHRHYLNQRYIEVFESSTDEFWKFADSESDASDHRGAKESVFVMRMQGLPYRITEQEIVDFFSDAPVTGGEDGVMLVRYPDGRASGDGYVVFSSDKDLDRAMSHNKENIGSRYVDLFKSSVKDFKTILSTSASPEEQQHFSKILGTPITANPEIEALRGRERKCVKLRGLPWTSTPDDVLQFFGELKNDIAPKGVHMVLNSNNRPTGECYVQVKSEDAASKASRELNKQYIGNRYVEVFQCSGDEVAKALMEQGIGGSGSRGQSSSRGDRSFGGRRGFGGGGGSGSGGRRRQGSGSGNTVKARGLPYSATEADVAEFFAEYDVNEDDVEMLYNREGRPAGVAFVTFQSRQLAQEAIQEKNRKNIGSRYVELSFPSD